jgi:hypothetical protein
VTGPELDSVARRQLHWQSFAGPADSRLALGCTGVLTVEVAGHCRLAACVNAFDPKAAFLLAVDLL